MRAVDLSRLQAMCPDDLQREWSRACGTPPPNIAPDLLRMGIAFALQDRRDAGNRMDRKLARAAAQPVEKPPMRKTLSAGTQLIRSWQGRTISVAVTDEGFVFEDRRYSSLSRIASEVTGTRWSGPRFFGLTDHG
ncbi:DUF2924 domain-containing protein [Sphingomonas montanisoli]|uniref:DUF2924 domain-containing protein n=1 Tax=Sphingomonas montanisoli TaxID=2606412 RepID=A0A5D9C3W9_9SPHN|nr:DUF2924 domain-containing protein [Sphingomonas montanisoli]TZG25972.1 DUF2924 domain-containing protein [Sphingomonas montanisoli]